MSTMIKTAEQLLKRMQSRGTILVSSKDNMKEAVHIFTVKGQRIEVRFSIAASLYIGRSNFDGEITIRINNTIMEYSSVRESHIPEMKELNNSYRKFCDFLAQSQKKDDQEVYRNLLGQ